MLAQVTEVPPVEQPNLILTPLNGILVAVLIVLVVGYKIYKNKTMT
jgi:hypothetical protein